MKKAGAAAFLFCFGGFCSCGCHAPRSTVSGPVVPPSAPGWTSDPKLAGLLGPEETVGGYGIQPPAGYTLRKIAVQAGDGSGIRCIWTGPAHADGITPFLQVDIGTDNGGASSRFSSDDDVQIGFQLAAQNHGQMVYSPLEQGVVNGLAFSRGYWKGYGQKTGQHFHGLVYGRIASPAVITITGRDDEPSHLQSLPLLEASALTMRKL